MRVMVGYVVGYSGLETAEDRRTHFGIFSPAVTELSPWDRSSTCTRGSPTRSHPAWPLPCKPTPRS